MKTCAICGSKKIKRTKQDITVKHKKYGEIELSDIPGTECVSCSERFLTPADNKAYTKQLTDKVRERENLLTSEEIKDLVVTVKVRFNISQRRLEIILGLGEKSFIRWIRGTVKQNVSTDILLRLIRQNPSFLKELKELRQAS